MDKQAPREPRLRAGTALLILAAFFAAITFPLWGHTLSGAGEAVAGENRALAPWPGRDTAFSDYPAALEDYFDDHLAFRGRFVSLVGAVNGVGRAEIVGDVARGLDGFLYYMGDGSREDILRRAAYSENQLEAIRDAQAETAAAVAGAGAKYVLMICPDKHTVYPEYLPEALRGAAGDTRIDQALEALSGIGNLAVVDTRAAVTAEKAAHLVFYKTDTHWNSHGAFAAYEVLAGTLSELLPNFRPAARADYEISDFYEWTGTDMAGMLGEEMTDLAVNYTPINASAVSVPNPYTQTSENPLMNILIFENPEHPELPTAVVFRDSFGNALMPFMADSFSRVVFVWSTYVRMDFVEAEKPDVVIQQYVERLSTHMSVPPAPAGGDIVAPRPEGLPLPTGRMLCYVDSLDTAEGSASVAGWAFQPGRDTARGELSVALVKGDQVVHFSVATVIRTDVTAHYADEYGDNLDFSGYSAAIPLNGLEPGTWDLHIILAGKDGATDSIDTGADIQVAE